MFYLLRYQLLPPSSPFSLAREPLKFSLEGFGGLLNEVPRTLPRGRIWANLINLGSPITIPPSVHWSMIPFQSARFLSLSCLGSHIHLWTEVKFGKWVTCLCTSVFQFCSRRLILRPSPGTKCTFNNSGHIFVKFSFWQSGASRVCLLVLLSHKSPTETRPLKCGVVRATVDEQLSWDANLRPLMLLLLREICA